MEALPDEEVCRVMQYLDKIDLLSAPLCSRSLSVAVASWEEWLWGRVLESELRKNAFLAVVHNTNGVEELCTVPEVKPTRMLSSKAACRVRRYLVRHNLPSLNDALRYASGRDHRAIVALLLRAGADANASADSGAFGVGFTQVGAFPIHLAAKRSLVTVMEELASAGADVDAADQNGRTALMVAGASGQVVATRWLAQRGAALDATNHYGFTALHFAAQLPRAEIVEVLLEAGAASNKQDRSGQTPLHVVLNTVPRRAAQLGERRVPTSCDPRGFGDEYCYLRDTSHGYSCSSAQEVEQDSAVKRAVAALLRHGAQADLTDERDRTPQDLLQGKRRPDLSEWFEAECRRVGGKEIDEEGEESTSAGEDSAEASVECLADPWEEYANLPEQVTVQGPTASPSGRVKRPAFAGGTSCWSGILSTAAHLGLSVDSPSQQDVFAKMTRTMEEVVKSVF